MKIMNEIALTISKWRLACLQQRQPAGTDYGLD